ncbi:hypothetical protein PAI11_38430 [Patulibacter medicamentivorans]|uniref:Secreted protein n=1 Tax=Patulibacter medicamentivorans TaxID=1097667 RepID=H0EAG9_9ACTN|nr:hypothetical protein [Patulibacter medicamentivorans]EHN09296.1 hypothetical protein PAI11_38430 [Patulibacter medicamentivorans]
MARALLALAVGLAALGGPTDAHAAIVDEQGDLSAVVDAFEDALPEGGSEGYDVPTVAEADTMADAYAAIRQGKLSQAATLAAPLKYDVVRFHDTAVARDYVLLRERQNPNASWPHAWGLYVHAPDAVLWDAVVEAPHPLFDTHTFDIAVRLMRDARAADLLLAGTHRNANAATLPSGDKVADVAHAPGSVFQAINQVVVDANVVVTQLHGFAEDRPAACKEVAVSAGVSTPHDVVTTAAQKLIAQGLTVFTFSGTTCGAPLAGTENVQGDATRAAGGRFLHVELREHVRGSATSRAKVAAGISGALSALLPHYPFVFVWP